jgi:hypothetical protein
MDFKSIESARRFYNAVPADQKVIVDGVYYIVRNTCGEAELEPVCVYGVPYQGE